MVWLPQIIQGQFKDDKMNGKGTYYYFSGNKYVGDMVNGDKIGQGIFYWATGARYEMRYSQITCHHTFY
jgi:hypothetical protein